MRLARILSWVCLASHGQPPLSLIHIYLGAALLVAFPEVLRSLESYRFVVYGLILVVMMRFRPQGILGWQSRSPYKLPKGVEASQISGEL